MFNSLLEMLMFITALNFEPEIFEVTQCIYFKPGLVYIILEIEIPNLSFLIMSHKIIKYVEEALWKLIQFNNLTPVSEKSLIRSDSSEPHD